jgi:hypothetical protein
MFSYETARSVAARTSYIRKNLLAPAGFTYRYLVYRLLRPLLKIAYRWHLRDLESAPWLSPPAIRVLDALLAKDHVGFEFGSGRSTFFLAKRIRQLTSLEHDSSWFEKVNAEVRAMPHVRLFLIQQETGDKPFLIRRSSDDLTVEYTPATCFTKYASFINQFPDHSFDFILVDGRARVECTTNALPKLKPGGMLILDNSERKRYQPIHQALSNWPRVDTTTGLFDTTFWFKPTGL